MKKGFTLAETLITLVIVGTVAAMTIPSLVGNYRYKVYSASLKKTYSQLSDAILAVMNDEDAKSYSETTAGINNDCTSGKEKGPCFLLRNYFNVIHECQGSNKSKCVGKTYKSKSGNNAGNIYGDVCGMLTSGATICMTYNKTNKVTSVFMDVNGPSAPNIAGIDAFVANIKNETGEVVDWTGTCGTASSGYGHIADYAAGCLEQTIKNGWVIKDED